MYLFRGDDAEKATVSIVSSVSDTKGNPAGMSRPDLGPVDESLHCILK
eukprot:COSAG01_NODE_5298_length_4352_cov_3.291089_5_plen_48_part_00